MRIKVYGNDVELIEDLLEQIEKRYLCIISPILPSDQGGYHAFGTIKGGKN